MLYYVIPVSANIPLFTAMRTVVLNFYIIVIIFLIFYVNKKTFCSCDSFKRYIGYMGYLGNFKK